MRAVRFLSFVVLLLGVGVVVGSPPAGAAVSVSSAGNQFAVSVTGNETVSFSCVGGTARVNGVTGTVPIACGSLTGVTLTGDGGAQTVNGADLDDPAFTAGPSVNFTMNGGADVVTDTLRNDTITMGAGTDRITTKAQGVGNLHFNMGADQDTVFVEGTPEADGLYIGSSGQSATILALTAAGNHTTTISATEIIVARGRGGDDGLSSVDVGVGSSLGFVQLDGGDGSDSLLSGTVGAQLFGGAGPNQITGGGGADLIRTSSVGDTISPGGGTNRIIDSTSLRTGGRSITTFSGARDLYELEHPLRDGVVRVRPGASGGSVTSSLARPGRQDIGTSFAGVRVSYDTATTPNSRHLVDLVLPQGSETQTLSLDKGGDDLVDVTIPAGTWTEVDGPVTFSIDPAGPYGTVQIFDAGPVSVHGPWTDVNDGYAHRVVRDLLFRFLTPEARTTLATRVAFGTPRSLIVGELMGTDEYRGLDVDRIFVQYLRRQPDAGGRTFWIGSIAGGNPLWRMRAQVFGSPEYFSKAGGTNAGFVRKAYADVLGRLPDAAGEQYWVNRLAAGDLRSVVAKQFLTVAETRNAIVDDQFLRFLDRVATPTERATWSPRMNESGGEQALIRSLAASATYFGRS